jgi:hypothetical protein
VVAFVAIYKRGFGVPSHRFLRSLLQYYGLELHNLTPSGILHITAFVTMCEAFMGMDPTSTCRTTSFTSDSRRAQTRKQWFWVAWTSMSSTGMASIPISTSPCVNL